jgi:signal transduction histidine kinase
LSIAYRIIEIHDGSIDVRSAPDQGTTFTIRLPLAPQEEPADLSRSDL